MERIFEAPNVDVYGVHQALLSFLWPREFRSIVALSNCKVKSDEIKKTEYQKVSDHYQSKQPCIQSHKIYMMTKVLESISLFYVVTYYFRSINRFYWTYGRLLTNLTRHDMIYCYKNSFIFRTDSLAPS